MSDIHDKLMEKGGAYAKWHKNPKSQIIQWLFLIAVTVSVGSLLINRMREPQPVEYGNLSLAKGLSNKPSKPDKKFASNQLLVKVKASARSTVKEGNASTSGLAALAEIDKTKKVKSFTALSSSLGLYLVTFDEPYAALEDNTATVDPKTGLTTMAVNTQDLDNKASLYSAKNKLAKDSKVDLVEYNYQVDALAIPSDPSWNQQWDMNLISAPQAWDKQTDSSDVVVAVIDTGIDFTHPDLQANLWTASDGSHGFTCINGSCVIGGQDDYGHGTHVAGTIGAVANNGVGMAGENWKTKILSCKFLDQNGAGNISDAVLCFNKILALKQQGVNIRVTSNSWGGAGFDQSLKDAMAAVENAGIIDVAAAGNSAVNADLEPMYPGAFDNRGLVSVIATDQNDYGAYFTNYGLASTDIAAPGVSTYSTVPTTGCPLCDPSGYKTLSGTSMATPHVSGVLAAMIHINPNLTTAQARDVLLDPGSYDAMTDRYASWTSSGGRLNFFKAITNPDLLSPKPLNNFPSITGASNVVANAGDTVSLSASASDPDGDPTRLVWSQSKLDSSDKGLIGCAEQPIFPSPSGNGVSFQAPIIGRNIFVPYAVSAADGRGGGATGSANVTVLASSSHGLPPNTGTFSVTPTSGPTGTVVTINFPTDPEGGVVYSTLWSTWGVSGVGVGAGWLCNTGSYFNLPLNQAGSYRISVLSVDSQLNFSNRVSTVVHIGGDTSIPPIASLSLDKVTGQAPLTVNVDISGSTDPDGSVNFIRSSILCSQNSGAAYSGPTHACTFDTPGTYWVQAHVLDNTGLMDVADAYVTVTASNTPPPPPAPHLSLSPTSLSFSATSGGATPASKPLTIGNSGSVSSNWTASTNQAWCHISPTSGSNVAGGSTTASVSVDSPSNIGTFSCNVSITDSAADNSPQTEVVSYTVNPPPDSIAPSVPTNLSANAVSASQVNLSWSASTDNVGVTGYRIYRNGTSLATTAGTTFSDTNLQPQISYSYTVAAYDAAGNQSAQSLPSVTTTLAAPVSITSYSITSKTNNYATVTWKTNVPSTGVIKYGTSSSNLNSQVSDSNLNTTHTLTLLNLNKSTRYYYQITATGNGQTASTKVDNFRTNPK